MKVAFLITVYKNDNLKHFQEAIQSIINQDFGFENINIYLGIDGYIPDDIKEYINKNGHFFYKIIKNNENKGLAYTLNRLIDNLENEKYVFRMDSDDISLNYRVRKQVDFLERNPQIEILGGAIEEFIENKKKFIIRKYPKNTAEAKKYIYKGSIFAHPTVCFRKTFFEKGFRYNSQYRFNQDLELWFRILKHNIEIANLDDVLVRMRVSDAFFERRGITRALTEFKIYWHGIIELYGYNWRLIFPILRLILRISPKSLRKFFYLNKLRELMLNRM